MDRRQFLKKLLFGLLGIASFIFIYHKPKGKIKKILKIGNKELLKSKKLIVIDEKWAIYSTGDIKTSYAINLTCKHLGCLVLWHTEKNKFICPCHKSEYSKTGSLLKGPAKEGLSRFKLITKGNILYINLEEKV